MNILPIAAYLKPKNLASENKAAADIQKRFRGYMVRSEGFCVICQEEDKRINLQTICPLRADKTGGHFFHLDCAQNSFARMSEAKCPTCKIDLSEVRQAQQALNRLGSRASNYAEPTITVNQAYQNYVTIVTNMPANPSLQSVSEAQNAYNLWLILQTNANSIA